MTRNCIAFQFIKMGGILSWVLAGPSLCHADGLLAISNPAKNESRAGGFFITEIFQANDNVAMRDYGALWLGDYSAKAGVNTGLLFARAQAGVQWEGYRLAKLHRGEALVKTQRDTTDLVRQYHTQSGFDSARTYPLDYTLRGFEASGISLSKSWQTQWSGPWQLRTGVSLSHLRGIRLKLENITGQVVTINAKDVNAMTAADSSSSTLDTQNLVEFNAPYGKQLPLSGEGYSIDAGIVINHGGTGIRIEIALADIASRMDWKNVPNNLTNYDTATKYYDANGFVQFNSAVTRTSSYQNITQTLPIKAHVTAVYPWQNWEAEGAVSSTQDLWLVQLGAKYKLSEVWAMRGDYDVRFASYGIGLEHPYFQLILRTDNREFGATRAYGLLARFQIPI